MNRKQAVISVSSTHAYDTENEDLVEFSTDGHYGCENGVGEIVYYESEVTGMPGTRTCIGFSDNCVTVSRTGTVTSEMCFKNGYINSMVYDTPYGSALMNINTHSVDVCFDEQGGCMVLEYSIDVEHVVVARNRFIITVREFKMGEIRNG